MKNKLLRSLTLLGKVASVGTGIASLPILGFLPPSSAAYAALAFGICSTFKDTATILGDLADDGIRNNSYDPSKQSRL